MEYFFFFYPMAIPLLSGGENFAEGEIRFIRSPL